MPTWLIYKTMLSVKSKDGLMFIAIHHVEMNTCQHSAPQISPVWTAISNTRLLKQFFKAAN